MKKLLLIMSISLMSFAMLASELEEKSKSEECIEKLSASPICMPPSATDFYCNHSFIITSMNVSSSKIDEVADCINERRLQGINDSQMLQRICFKIGSSSSSKDKKFICNSDNINPDESDTISATVDSNPVLISSSDQTKNKSRKGKRK